MSAYKGWAIVELMGRRRIAGTVTEVEQYGTRMLRIDVPAGSGDPAGVDYVSQFYGGSAIYCVTPATEETVRKVAGACDAPAPGRPWELPLPALPVPPRDDDDDDDDDDDEQDDDEQVKERDIPW